MLMKTLFRISRGILCLWVLLGTAHAQFQGYNMPVYLLPDAATGSRGWQNFVSNALWMIGDARNPRAALLVTTNGTVFSGLTGGDLGTASNPWRSNYLAGGLVLGAGAPVVFGDGSLQSTASQPTYRLTPTGLSLALAPCQLRWADGSLTSIPAQSIPLLPNATNQVGLDLFDLTLHNYPRALDMGTKWLAQVVTDANGVISQLPLATDADVPPHRFEGIKQKLLDGGQPVAVAILGDSISGPYPGYTTNWVDVLFNQPGWLPVAYLPRTAIWSVTNYSVGTQTPMMGMCLIGNSVVAAQVATSGNLGYVSTIYGDLAGTGGGSPVLETQPDLVIIGYYNNSTYYKLPYIERLVQRARARGSAVILHATEANQAVGWNDRQPEGPVLRNIADQHGAMFLDTWARAYEARNLRGVVFSPPGDQLHPNDSGHLLWAAWMRAVLPTNRQRSERINASPILTSLPGAASPAAQLAFPFGMDMEFQFPASGSYATNIAYSNPAFFNSANPAIVVGNRPVANGAVALPVGASAVFAHPHALTFSLLVDGFANSPNGFSYSISVGSTTVATGSFGNVGPRPAVVEILSVEQMRALPASLYNYGKADAFENLSLAVNITAGMCVLYGGVWGVPARREVALSTLSYSGSGWDLTEKPGDNASTLIRGTDTPGDAVRFSFAGAGAQLLLQGGTGAGKVRIYLDGTPVGTVNGVPLNPYYDLFIGANRFAPINLFPSGGVPGNVNFFSSAVHTVKVLYDGSTNAAAIAPTATKRRLAVCGATIFGPPDLVR